MKAIRLFTPLLFILFFAQANAQSGKETLTVKTNIHCDHCQKCESCAARIYRYLKDTPGVRKVDINDKEETITVDYKADKTSPETIRKAINEAGFEADDQQPSADQLAGLDGCCRPE